MKFIFRTFCKIFPTAFLLLSSFGFNYGQTANKEPIFVGSVRPQTEDIHNASSDKYQLIQNYFESSDDRIAIRVCSKDPLPIAFAFAVGQPFIALDYWKLNGNFINTKIYFLRQNKRCELKPNFRYLTEYWVVPQGAKFPVSVEIKRAEDLELEYLTSSFSEFDGEIISSEDWIKLTPDYYKKVESKILESLKEDKRAMVLLETPNSKKVWKRALRTKRFLTKRSIKNSRIFIKKNNYFYADKKYKYPNITVVRQK